MSPNPPDPTLLANLIAARDNIGAQLAAMTASPKPTYSIDGESVSWTDHFNSLVQRSEDLNRLIQVAGGPFELQTTFLTNNGVQGLGPWPY